MKNKLLIVLAFLLANVGVKAQDYLDDVMFQSFGWDEYAQSKIISEGSFYEFYNSNFVHYAGEEIYDGQSIGLLL